MRSPRLPPLTDNRPTRAASNHAPRTTPFIFSTSPATATREPRASQGDRQAFRHLIRHTLERARLAGVLWLLDIRREPSDDDRATHELFAGRETPVLAVLTKSDTLPRAGRVRRERELRETLELDADQVIRTSAREQEGVEELREAIGELVSTSGAPG